MKNDSTQQAKCAAGSLCEAPDDAKLEESTHHCFECKGKIHSILWCGRILSDINSSGSLKITADQLSSAGRVSFQSSDHDLLSICRVCIARLSTSASDTTTTTWTTASMKRKGSELLDDRDLSSRLKGATQTTREDTTADGVNAEAEKEEIVDWKLVSSSAVCVAKWWKYYQRFNSVAHPNMKDYAACTLCFAVGKCAKGTISIKGGGTGGIKRHLQNNHTREFEILDGGKKTVVGGGSLIVNHFKPRGKDMRLEDIKLLFVTAAASWAITEAVPFSMFSSRSFRRMFEPLNKDASKIVNVGQPCHILL